MGRVDRTMAKGMSEYGALRHTLTADEQEKAGREQKGQAGIVRMAQQFKLWQIVRASTDAPALFPSTSRHEHQCWYLSICCAVPLCTSLHFKPQLLLLLHIWQCSSYYPWPSAMQLHTWTTLMTQLGSNFNHTRWHAVRFQLLCMHTYACRVHHIHTLSWMQSRCCCVQSAGDNVANKPSSAAISFAASKFGECLIALDCICKQRLCIDMQARGSSLHHTQFITTSHRIQIPYE